jgi:hypothetical protein
MSVCNRWRFGGGLLACLTACAVVHSQQAPGGGTPPAAPPSYESLPATPSIPAPTPAVAPAPKRQTVEELIAAVKAVRAKKAELDRQEQALTAALRMRVAEQGKQLAELGIAPKAEPAPQVAPTPGVPPPVANPPAPEGPRSE